MRLHVIAPLALLSALTISESAKAQAPEIRRGECLYLLGAPPGAPAATTQQSYEGTKVHDVTSWTTAVDVGRDAPHRLTAVIRTPPAVSGAPAGAHVTAWSEHEFLLTRTGATLVTASAWGDIRGALQAAGLTDGECSVSLALALVHVEGGSQRIVAQAEVLRRSTVNALVRVDETWARSLSFIAPVPGTYRLRLTLEIRTELGFRELDFDRAAEGYGAQYAGIEICTTPIATSDEADSDLERDLYERRCMPSVWLPAAQGGRLEEAQALVSSLTDRAEVSADDGANIVLARQRLLRAQADAADGKYQRACKSLSDAVRGLTTP